MTTMANDCTTPSPNVFRQFLPDRAVNDVVRTTNTLDSGREICGRLVIRNEQTSAVIPALDSIQHHLLNLIHVRLKQPLFGLANYTPKTTH
jgi:hypothetical protein